MKLKLKQKMKLYDLPRDCDCLVKILPQNAEYPLSVAIETPDLQEGEYILFGHTDGMYSLCHNMENEIVNPAAWTEVEIVRFGIDK